MAIPTQETVTRLLEDIRSGNKEAIDALLPLVYDELHALAHRTRYNWYGDYTLNTTALVHEAYLKLVGQSEVALNSRAHFFKVAGIAMRHILINYADQRRAEKRGGDRKKISFDEMRLFFEGGDAALTQERAEILLLLDETLKQLEKENERQSQIVECRFFGGMTVEETAVALGVSTPTVKRGWAMAKAWLYREMKRQLEQ